MKGEFETLSIEEAVIGKFGFFAPKDPCFSVKELGQMCTCGAPLLCVCHRSDDLANEKIVAKHLCLNKHCHRSNDGDHQRVKSIKRGPIENCPICWRSIGD